MRVRVRTLANHSFEVSLDGPKPTLTDLRAAVAGAVQGSVAGLRLVHKGKVLPEEGPLTLADGDKVLMAMSAAPAGETVRVLDEPPPAAGAWWAKLGTPTELRRYLPAVGLVGLLLATRWSGLGSGWMILAAAASTVSCQYRDALTAWVSGISPSGWARAGALGLGMVVATKTGFGLVYGIGAAIYLIWLNLSDESRNGPSAYSVFNRDFQPLPGELNAEQLIPGGRQG